MAAGTRMLRAVRLLLAAALLALALPGGTAAAQQTTTDDAGIAGRWNVFYSDRMLGPVTGYAFVDEAETKATVVLTHPVTRKPYEFESREFSFDGGRLRMTLAGTWPGGEGRAYDIGETVAGSQTVTVSLGDSTEKFEFATPSEADRDTVRIDLQVARGSMTGEWSYKADPRTGRDADGGGRTRFFEYAGDGSGLGIQSGPELWSRPQPRILYAVPVEDQLGSRVYAHPDGIGRNYRELLVLGYDLPIQGREPVTVGTADEQISYTVREPDDRVLEKGWARLERQLDGAGYAALRQDYDDRRLVAFQIEATLARDVTPGLSHFTLNGAEASWLLQFQDYTATIDFVRQTAEAVVEEDVVEITGPAPLPAAPGQGVAADAKPPKRKFAVELVSKPALYEPAVPAYLPEAVRVRIHAARELPYDRIPLFVGIDGKFATFGAQGGSDDRRELVAYRSEDDPRVYLTPPIALIRAGDGGTGLAGLPADALLADRPVEVGQALTAQINIESELLPRRMWPLRTTSTFATTTVERAPSNNGIDNHWKLLTWPAAMEAAARCHDIAVEDPWKDSVRTVDSFTRYIANAAFVSNVDWQRKTDVKLGDHAAMLLMRDTFADTIDRHVRGMRAALQTPEGLRSTIRPYVDLLNRDSPRQPPLLTVPIAAPSGTALQFMDSFGSAEEIEARTGLTGRAARDWQRDVTVRAVTTYLRELGEARTEAFAVDDCNLQDLVDLTGRGFQAIAAQARPRLLWRAGGDGPWVPDRVGRAWVDGLSLLADAVASDARLSSQDNSVLMIEAAAFFVVPAALHATAAGGAWILGGTAPQVFVLPEFMAAGSLVMDFGEFGYSTYRYLTVPAANAAEVEFARKSAAVLGFTRYHNAREKARLEQADVEIDLLFAFGGAMGAVGDAVKGARYLHDTRRVANDIRDFRVNWRHNVRGFATGGFSELPRLSELRALERGRALFEQVLDTAGLSERAIAERAARAARDVEESVLERIKRETLAELAKDFESRSFGADNAKAIDAEIRELSKKIRANRDAPVADEWRRRRKALARMREKSDLLFDPSTVDPVRLDREARRIAADAFEEGERYGLSEAVRIYRTKRRLKAALTGQGFAHSGINRVVSGAERSVLTMPAPEAFDGLWYDLQKMTLEERQLLLEYMSYSLVEATLAGKDALKFEAAVAAQAAQRFVELVRRHPPWLDALTLQEYRRAFEVAHRPTFHRLLKESPGYLKQVIADDFALEVLRGEPFRSAAELQAAVKRAKARIRKPVPGVWDEAGDLANPPPGLEFKDAVHAFGEGKQASISIYDGGRDVGQLVRTLSSIDELRRFAHSGVELLDGLAGGSKGLTMDLARVSEDLPSMLATARNPMIPGKGTPLSVYLNLRVFQQLGIGFGDPSLVLCKLDGVLNQKTALQIEWLSRQYPGRSVEELLSHTHSYQYAESALTQAGYRIKEVRIGEADKTIHPLAEPWGSAAAFGKEGHAGFLSRYGFADVAEQAPIEIGHDIYLYLEPLN
ncbi:hypothetical protein GCM10017083_04480 [Thalassobaculum fulvum]|uniref:Uncharacterized protein n=2 Tax=Thalassobaculum fulvum TaxID=1633335 RepID=A0A918XNZ7_9PROT|nr:hypothetical protein GCM10017083_04480 [Thalassobaculum fulvum]